MKFFQSILVLSLLFSTYVTSANSSINIENENFSLETALELFKYSSSLEEFEAKLNNSDNYANNLDLNADGDIDYIRVEDKMSKDLHAIILQAVLDENEVQDIAVIEIEKTGEEEAILQIVGSEDLFGDQKIVEPFEEVQNSNGKGGPSVDVDLVRLTVNVFFWKPVRFIYRPAYRPYVSPYRWRVYPRSWKPWRPRSITVLTPHWNRHRVHYHTVRTHRVHRAHSVYVPHKRNSVLVVKKKNVKHNHKVVKHNHSHKKNVSKKNKAKAHHKAHKMKKRKKGN